MMTQDAVIIDGARLPVARGGAGGALSLVPPEKFGAHLLRELVKRSGIKPEEMDDVFLGNVMGAYLCFSRLCLLEAGLPINVPGLTMDRNCASGMQAIAGASQAVRCGEADLMIAGGADSMTRQPWFIEKPVSGFPRGPIEPRILAGGRATAPLKYGDFSMGETAENVAEQYHITREAQEALALESHRRAARAWKEGRFDQEVIPFTVPRLKGKPVLFDRDETIRDESQLERMPTLPTIFRQGGSVTAATSSPVSDGAAAVIIMSGTKAREQGFKPIVRVLATASAGVDPAYMGMGPVPATKKALKLAGLTIEDVGLVEFNEAFAAQTLACYRELGLDTNKVNVNGGAMALGHPIGATGARLTVTLMHEMRRRGVRYGLAAMCVGGGQGSAIVYELVNHED